MANVKKPLLLTILILSLFAISFFLMFPTRTFVREPEISEQGYILELIQYNDQVCQIETFHVLQSDTGQFHVTYGTLVNDGTILDGSGNPIGADEQQNFIALFRKLPLIDYYYLQSKFVYTGGTEPGQHIMTYPRDTVTTPAFRYEIVVDPDAVSVSPSPNFSAILFLVLIAAVVVSYPIRKFSRKK